MDQIFVNGANGHLGRHIVRELRKRGYRVRASVSNAKDTTKTSHLVSSGIDIVESSLTDKKSLEKAIQGCSAVFHVAAPFKMHAKDLQKEIYEPVMQGTENILEIAQAAKVEKIVYTSSVGCIGSTEKGGRALTEDDWIKSPDLMYIKAKTDAEKLFHDFMQSRNLKGVAALPSTMIGPNFVKPSPSIDLFVKLVNGQLPAILPVHFDYVDVRDVAKGHVDLFEKENAVGRYILSGKGYYLKDIVNIIHHLFPDMKIPKVVLPIPLFPVAIFSDWLEDKIKHTGRMLTFDVLKEFGNGKMQNFSSARAQKEIGWNPRPIEESLRDTIEWIKKDQLLKPGSNNAPAASWKKMKSATSS